MTEKNSTPSPKAKMKKKPREFRPGDYQLEVDNNGVLAVYRRGETDWARLPLDRGAVDASVRRIHLREVPTSKPRSRK